MSGSMIFGNTLHADEAWHYFKWWLSAEMQLDFVYSLRSMYGPEFYWIPGNLDVMWQMYFPKEHLEIIMEQRSWEKEAFRHPAWYMLERTLSNAWTTVVNDDRNQLVAINRAAVESDREITRKMIEFGYIDEQGNTLKNMQTQTVENLRQMLGGQNP
jgi:ABC-type glycerol-3-phosphate transport system substrate-binding protein